MQCLRSHGGSIPSDVSKPTDPASELLTRSRVDPIFGDHEFHQRIDRFLRTHPERPHRVFPRGTVSLPLPEEAGVLAGVSLAAALEKRASTREFGAEPLSLPPLAALLRGAYGVRDGTAARSVPSAGGFWALNLYAVVRASDGFETGIYLFDPLRSTLERLAEAPTDDVLFECAPGLRGFGAVPAVIVVTADLAGVGEKYGPRGGRFVLTEYGAVLQNAHLVAAAIDWGVCAYGGGYDRPLEKLIAVDPGREVFIGAFVFGRPSRGTPAK